MSIGKLIEDEVRKQELSITEFARLIYCQRNNVYDIFNRNNMDIILLKQISKVLNRNFFKEIAEDIELIYDGAYSEADIEKRKAVSQFYEVVPEILQQLGKSSTIVFSKIDDAEYEDCPTPDFGLPDYFITFTILDTLKERIGNDPLLPIETKTDESGIKVEICTNIIFGSVFVNIQIDYKSQDEWYKTLKFAFDVYAQYGRRIL